MSEQQRFRDKSLSLYHQHLNSFGRYTYDIPFENNDGIWVDRKYSVCQFFVDSYCLERNLDYEYFFHELECALNINDFKNSDRYFLPIVYEKIVNFINNLNNEYNVSVYFSTNNKMWSLESLKFHYLEKGNSFSNLSSNIEIINFAKNDNINYNHYPIFKNRHIVIIDIQTKNNHLKEVCTNVINYNIDKKPLITYISFLKEYDRIEMQDLISDFKRKKSNYEERKQREHETEERRRIEYENEQRRIAEAEARQRAEQDRYKPDRYNIINILRYNNISYFYHFTARENIPYIKRYGGLYSWHALREKNIKVPFIGGAGLGQDLDTRYGLQDYVRLSFCRDHPMQWRHKQNGVNLVLLTIDTEVATWRDTLFSDINATANNHHCGGEVSDLEQVDFNAVRREYIRRDDPDFATHQAEILVKTFIPIQYITNINFPITL